jgi:hypothetical protein
VESPASPALVEETLFSDPDYSHSSQGDENHPMDPSHLSKESSSQMEETTGLKQPTQRFPSEEGNFSLALVINQKLTSQRTVEA